MGAADKVRDCVIRQTIYVRLTPRHPIMEGDRDVAIDVSAEVGKGLVIEAMKVLQMAAEREGFEVTIDLGQVVY